MEAPYLQSCVLSLITELSVASNIKWKILMEAVPGSLAVASITCLDTQLGKAEGK